jgi:predicted 2-oxoglutarate/Fe(II)-dependent dioxygenase YbiX
MEDREGGSIGLPVTGEAGSLIAFPSDMVHEVTPVSRGERYTVVSWFY